MKKNVVRTLFIFTSLIAMIYTIQCTTPRREELTKYVPPPVEVKPLKTWTEPNTGMEFVWVPEGCYEMGCGPWTKNCLLREKPVHEVCLDGFWLAQTEVTQGQWKKLMRQNNSRFTFSENHPVERVTWQEAKNYAQKLTELHDGKYLFQLPTEAEWEYAARSGGKPEMFSGGYEVRQVAWFRPNSMRHTNPVGRKWPNGLALYDMSGNVWEWVRDQYSPNAYQRHERNNPVILENASNNATARGGGWDHPSPIVRTAHRDEYKPGVRSMHIGFRVAMYEKKQ